MIRITKGVLVPSITLFVITMSLFTIRLPQASSIPISHIIVVMQENRTFDHYFGTYPGSNGIPPGTQLATKMIEGKTTGCGSPRRLLEPTSDTSWITPHHLDTTRTPDPPHDEKTARLAIDCGRVDGLIYAQGQKNFSADVATGYYDYHDIPYYWDLAQYYTLADNFFSSHMGGSFQNHLFLYAAADSPPSGPGCPSGTSQYTCIPPGGMDLKIIFDELESQQVSWKNYVQNYHPEVNYTLESARLGLDKLASQLIWTPPLGIARYVYDPNLNSKIQNLNNYFRDLNPPPNSTQPGGFPSVAFISPSGQSEHPPGDIVLGQLFIVNLLSALMTSQYWWNSVFILTYDDWGGWYDHVAPPQIDSSGYGFRVPALIISPYSRSGYIDNTRYDFTSILATIESLFGLVALRPNGRDGSANPLWSAFDFNSPPNAPVIPSGQYPQRGVSKTESAFLVWLTYAGTVTVSITLLFGALFTRRRGENSWFGSVQVLLL